MCFRVGCASRRDDVESTACERATRGQITTRRAHIGTRKQIILIGASAVAVLVVSAACNKVDTGRQDPAGQITSTTATASGTTPTAGAEAHNNADVWFVRQMIPHTTSRRSRRVTSSWLNTASIPA